MLLYQSVVVALLPGFGLASLVFTAKDNFTIGTSVAETLSMEGGLDQPKLSPIAANETTYDW